MEKDLINSSLHALCIQKAKSIVDVAQYLQLKYRLEVDVVILQKRLNRILHEERAVA